MKIKDYDTKLNNERLKFQENIRFLVDNPVRDFQVDNFVRLDSITVTLKNGLIYSVTSKLTPLVHFDHAQP